MLMAVKMAARRLSFVEQVQENQEVLATTAVDDDQDEEDVLQTHNRSSKSFSSALLSLYPSVFIFSFCLCSQFINLKLQGYSSSAAF